MSHIIEKRCVICGKTFKVCPCEKERQCYSRKCGAARQWAEQRLTGSECEKVFKNALTLT